MKLLLTLLLLPQGAFAIDYAERLQCGADVEQQTLDVPPAKGSVAEKIAKMFKRAASFTKPDKVRTEIEKILALFELFEAIGEGRTNPTFRAVAVESKLVTPSEAMELENLATPLRLTSAQVDTLKALCEKDHHLYPSVATLLLTGANPSEESVSLLGRALENSSPEFAREYDRTPRYSEFRNFASSVGTIIEANRRLLRSKRGPTGDQSIEEEDADWELEVDRRFDRAWERKQKK